MACRKRIHSSGLTNTADKIPGMKKLPIFLLFFPLSAIAAWGDFVFVPEEKQWTETEVTIPDYPNAQNLILFDAATISANRHYVDLKSIKVGEDRVIQYVIVIDTHGGARNVSFEGMRCRPSERRIYAYGRADNTWSPATTSTWQQINFNSGTSYQKALYREFFCPDGIAVKDAAEAIRNLRQATH